MNKPFLARLTLAAALATTLGGLPAAHAQDVLASEVVIPGVGAAKLVRVQVEVVSVDAANRVLTLRGPRGRSFSLEVGPEVQRFGEVKPGDWLQLAYYEALAVELKKGGDGIRERTEAVSAASAPAGSAPGAGAYKVITATTDVWSIDTKKQTVHIRGPRGHIVEVKVRDAKKLKSVKVGDQVEVTYVVGGAIQLEPIPAPVTTAQPKPAKK